MAETYKTVLPKSPIGQAIAYCIPRWDKLMNYLNDGSLEIDNNWVERIIYLLALQEAHKELLCFILSSELAKRMMLTLLIG